MRRFVFRLASSMPRRHRIRGARQHNLKRTTAICAGRDTVVRHERSGNRPCLRHSVREGHVSTSSRSAPTEASSTCIDRRRSTPSRACRGVGSNQTNPSHSRRPSPMTDSRHQVPYAAVAELVRQESARASGTPRPNDSRRSPRSIGAVLRRGVDSPSVTSRSRCRRRRRRPISRGPPASVYTRVHCERTVASRPIAQGPDVVADRFRTRRREGAGDRSVETA